MEGIESPHRVHRGGHISAGHSETTGILPIVVRCSRLFSRVALTRCVLHACSLVEGVAVCWLDGKAQPCETLVFQVPKGQEMPHHLHHSSLDPPPLLPAGPVRTRFSAFLGCHLHRKTATTTRLAHPRSPGLVSTHTTCLQGISASTPTFPCYFSFGLTQHTHTDSTDSSLARPRPPAHGTGPTLTDFCRRGPDSATATPCPG